MILGLSHVFGEASDIEAVVDYWKSNGWTSSVVLDLPVPSEKKTILEGKGASCVALHYLKRETERNWPGIEFVRHERRGPIASRPRALSMKLPLGAGTVLRDPEGNTIHSSGGEMRPLIELAVPNLKNARRRLLTFGFRQMEGDGSTLELASALFPQRSFSLQLREDAGRPAAPEVDEGGWNGMSLLVKDLAALAPNTPSLIARQSFSVEEGETREVAFFSGDGLLIEFLAIRRTRVPHRGEAAGQNV